MEQEQPSTYAKALKINLNSRAHGTFAEIGAGQEVARWFFRVGGAASTVAKTMSAYDMAVSDAIYGPTDRYVSRRRLESMLDHEYGLVLERVARNRSSDATLFVFADTVATRGYGRREEGHGWMGVRFQHEAQAPPSEVIIHVGLRDTENVWEQEAIGIIGVNLMYGVLYHREVPHVLIGSLMDGLTRERIEVDMIKFSGAAFARVDNRLMSLQLVEQGLTHAAMFTAKGDVVQPAELLYKKPVLIERGSFRPVTNATLDMVKCAVAQFHEEYRDLGTEPIVIMEMSLRNLLMGERIDHADFLARVDILAALGKVVMISNYGEHYPLSAYFRRYTSMPIVFVMGVPNLKELFDERYYEGLGGGILEAIGRLFQGGVKLYVYPSQDPDSGEVIRCTRFQVEPGLRHVYAHLLENALIEPVRGFDARYLSIFPHEVLAKLQAGDAAWETMVPEPVAEIVKKGQFFGYCTTHEAGRAE